MLIEIFTIRFDPLLRQQLNDGAKAEGRTVGALVRGAVRIDLQRRGLLPNDRQPLTAVRGYAMTASNSPQFAIESRPVKLPQAEWRQAAPGGEGGGVMSNKKSRLLGRTEAADGYETLYQNRPNLATLKRPAKTTIGLACTYCGGEVYDSGDFWQCWRCERRLGGRP